MMKKIIIFLIGMLAAETSVHASLSGDDQSKSPKLASPTRKVSFGGEEHELDRLLSQYSTMEEQIAQFSSIEAQLREPMLQLFYRARHNLLLQVGQKLLSMTRRNSGSSQLAAPESSNHIELSDRRRKIGSAAPEPCNDDLELSRSPMGLTPSPASPK